MKKFGKTLALLAAGALLFGSVLSSCSSGSDDDDDDDVSVTGVTLDPASLELKVGEKATLTATVAPDDATNNKVSWSTGSGEIATVDGGNVTAVAKGSTTITVKTEDGEKTASCTVSVYEAQEYKFGESTVVVKDFGEAGTKATVTASDGNKTEATVTVADGTMTIANSDGTTLYTATVKGDGTIDTSTVKDSGGNAVTVEEIVAITITAADGATSVEVDDTLQLTASVEGVTWSSSDDTKATVDQTGLVTGVAAAESVTIKASKEGNYTAGTITLVVKAAAAADDGSYIFTTNDLGYEHTEKSDTETINEVKTYLDEKVTLIASAGMSFTVAGFNSEIEVADLNSTKVRGYIKMTARDAITADNWLTSATRTIAFKVPAGTSKVYIAASNGSSKDGTATKSTNITVVYDKTNIALNKTLAKGEASGVATHEIDVADLGLTEDKIFYLYNSKENGGEENSTLNLRGIYVQMAASAKTVSSIKVTTNPTKTNYALNETFESTGLVVTATYSDGSTKTLSSAKYTLSSPDMTTTGDKEVTVTYAEGITGKFTINVGTLESIAVTSEPTNKTYSASDTELNLEGLAVTATYSNTYTKDVTSSATTSEFPAKSVGEQTITVSYIDGSVTEAKTASFKITVTSATQTGIKVTKIPTTTDYEKGSEINLTGLVVTAVLSDGSTGTSTTYSSESGITYVEGFDSSTAGENTKTITVKYGEYTATFDYTYTVTEKAKFTGFKASDLGKTDDASAYKTFSDTNGTWTVSRAKYQASSTMTASDGTEFTGRIKFNKASGDDNGTFTLNNVTVGSVLRIDGGNANSGNDVRKVSFSGTDKDSTTWDASYMGTFYVTATSETVVLTSVDNEFCIYAITIVDSATEKTTVSETSAYSKPVVSLTIAGGEASSETSQTCDQNASVTANATVANVSTVIVYSDGTKETKDTEFAGTLTWDGATASESDSKTATVATSTAQTISITAAYTVGEGDDAKTYTSDAISLTVQDANANYHTVTFYDGDTAIPTITGQSVKGGNKVEKPEKDPTKAGYTFSKWVTEKDGTTEYSFDTATADSKDAISIYASWTSKYSSDYTELFDTYGTGVYDVTTSLSDTVKPTAATTYYFASGISFVATSSDSMGKSSAEFTVGNEKVSATNRLVPNKAAKGAASSVINIPVAGNCTVTVLWYNNGTSDRGAYLSTANGKFTAVSGPEGFANSFSSSEGTAAWSTCNGKTKASNVSVFTYEGSGDTLALTNSKADGTAGGGGIYIYGVIVNYTTTSE